MNKLMVKNSTVRKVVKYGLIGGAIYIGYRLLKFIILFTCFSVGMYLLSTIGLSTYLPELPMGIVLGVILILIPCYFWGA